MNLLKKTDITYDRMKKLCDLKKYSFHEEIGRNNLFGVRSAVPVPDKFCDFFIMCRTEIFGEQITKQVFVSDYFTTDPGLYWLNKGGMNPKGCAILKEGQWKNMFTIGLHGIHQYEALVNIEGCGKVTVYRDSDRDNDLELKPGTEDTGIFNTDLHHAKDVGTTELVGIFSAGCNVFGKIEDFNYMLNEVRREKKILGMKYWDYTLVNEKDFTFDVMNA